MSQKQSFDLDREGILLYLAGYHLKTIYPNNLVRVIKHKTL